MKEIDIILNTLENSDCESTRSPYWIIIDPRQNFKVNEGGIHNIASMISGIFFSRKDAQEYLDRRRYNFSKHAKVYCHSGYHSDKYNNLHNKIYERNKRRKSI